MKEDHLPSTEAAAARWLHPVHPDGRKFVALFAGLTLLFAWAAWETLAWPMAGLTIWCAAFFRDPKRVTPRGPGIITSPADGLVTLIATVPPPAELVAADGLAPDPVVRVSIFMSVFDVHINRAPIGGTVRRVVYISGKFLSADLDKASEDNERQHLLIEGAEGLRIGFTQIAGLVARRIVPFVKPGDLVAAGQRIGLIRFGSRLDVYLPAGTAPLVAIGQRTVAGETVLAVAGRRERLSGVTQ